MYTGKNVTERNLPDGYVVCLYTRLSLEDNDVSGNPFKNESGSITSQRNLLYDFMKNREEFDGCKIIEKCDDGFSGTHFDNRPQFMEMMELARKGDINCIIVKDFSRFGRDYVELGNYLEQVFPFLGIRFISVNDSYDSASLAEGTTGGLDVAFKNLVYDYYSREMSKKQKTAWKRMAEKGQYNSNCALYGYKKSKEDKHKLVIEPEEAEIVREIFNLKISGTGTTMIAKMLNDRGVLSPSELYRSRGDTREWNKTGGKCYWTASRVEKILKDEKYTGTMVQLKTKLDSVGGKAVERPQSEWIKVENTHEAVISYPQYIRAVSSLKQQKAEEKRKQKNIYYCGNCNRALFNNHRGSVFCRMNSFKTDSVCKENRINKEKADKAVLEAVKKQ